jgi:hypothetical protein
MSKQWLEKLPLIISRFLLLAVCLTWIGPLTVAHAEYHPHPIFGRAKPIIWSHPVQHRFFHPITYHPHPLILHPIIHHPPRPGYPPTSWRIYPAVPAWNGNSIQYTVGEEVVYNGNLYQCLQANTSLPNLDPVDAPNLWQLISSNPPFPNAHVTRWRGNSVPYNNIGDRVTYTRRLREPSPLAWNARLTGLLQRFWNWMSLLRYRLPRW